MGDPNMDLVDPFPTTDADIQKQFTWESASPAADSQFNLPPRNLFSDLQTANGQDPALKSASEGSSSSTSFKGMTNSGMAKSKGLFDQAEADANSEIGQMRGQNAQAAAGYEKGYKTAEEAVSEHQAMAKEHYTNMSKIYDRMVDFDQHWQDTYQTATKQAQAESAQYIGQIQEQMAGVRQLMAYNANPLAHLTTGGTGLVGGAEFAQGFLAARGIHIDVAGQIDKIVQQSLLQHHYTIENAQSATKDTIHLFDIARQTSHDNLEAMQKFRAFTIEGLQFHVQQEASRFESSLADSHAKEQMAKLEIEKQTTLNSLSDKFFHESMAVKTYHLKKATDQGQLSIQQATLAESQRHHGALEAAAKAKTESKPDVRKYYDPTTGKVVGTITDKTVNADKRSEHMAEADRAYRENKPLIDRAVQQFNSVSAKGITGKALWEATDPEARAFQHTLKALAMNRQLYQSGKSSTEDEYKRIFDMFPTESKMQLGSNSKMVIQTMQDERNRYKASVESLTDAPTADIANETEPQRPQIDPRTEQAYKASQNGKSPVENPIEQERALAIEGPHTKGPATVAWQKFAQDRTSEGYKGQAPEYVRHMDAIAAAVIDPEMVIKAGNANGEDPSQVRKEAIAALTRMSNGIGPQGEKVKLSEYRQEYAKYLLDRIDADWKDDRTAKFSSLMNDFTTGGDEVSQDTPLLPTPGWMENMREKPVSGGVKKAVRGY